MRRIILPIFFLFLISFVCAGNLEINIQTLENHTLNLNLLNPENRIESYVSMTNNTCNGEMTLNFQNAADSYDIDVFLMKDGKKVIYESFKEIANDQKVLIVLVPGLSSITEEYSEPIATPEPATEEVREVAYTENESVDLTGDVIEQKEETETTKEENNSIKEVGELADTMKTGFFSFFKFLGFAVEDEKTASSGKGLYYISGVIGVFIIGFFLFRKSDILKKPKKSKSSSEDKKDDDTPEKDTTPLSREDKLKATKQRLIDDEKELMKLRENKE